MKSDYRWVRKPNFNNLPESVEYNAYWQFRGWEINKSLKNREKIAFEKIETGKHVIDIGCGNSKLPILLKEKGVNICVGDVATEVLKGYEKYGIKSYYIELNNIHSEKIPKNFDIIILFEVLEHLQYPEKVIKALSNNTREFLITVPNSGAYFYRLSLLFRGRFFTQWVYHPAEHLRFWTHIDFVDWLHSQNLEVIESVATDGFTFRGLIPGFPNLWKNLFAHRVLYRCKVKNAIS